MTDDPTPTNNLKVLKGRADNEISKVGMFLSNNKIYFSIRLLSQPYSNPEAYKGCRYAEILHELFICKQQEIDQATINNHDPPNVFWIYNNVGNDIFYRQ